MPGLGDPGAPVVGGLAHACVGLVDVLRRGELLRPGERAERLLSLLERVPRPRRFGFRPQRDAAAQPDRQSRSARVGGVWSLQRPVGRYPPVVEVRLAVQFHVDRALHAEHGSHEHVMGVLVGGRARVWGDLVLMLGRADRQRVSHHRPAGRRVPGGDEDVGAGLVDPAARHVDPEGAEAERAGLPVEQRAEDAGRVESRHAEPVDPTVRGHQGARMAVGEEGVVGDRREGRRHRRALRHSLLLAGRGRFAVSARRRLAAGAGLSGALLLRGTHDPVHGSCQPP